MSLAEEISCTVCDLQSTNQLRSDTHILLQSKLTGTPPLMLANGFYSQMLTLLLKSIATSDRPLPGGEIQLPVALKILRPRQVYSDCIPIKILTRDFRSGTSSLKHVIASSHCRVSSMSQYHAHPMTQHGNFTIIHIAISLNSNAISHLHTLSLTPAPNA